MAYCILCGEETVEGHVCGAHKFKKMCVNCRYSSLNEDGTYTCANEDNLNKTREKMIEAAKVISEGYEITDFKIAPLPLKKPNLKCKSWELNPDVLDAISKMFE